LIVLYLLGTGTSLLSHLKETDRWIRSREGRKRLQERLFASAGAAEIVIRSNRSPTT
jgi:hypothetical protein